MGLFPSWVEVDEDAQIHPTVVFVPHNDQRSYLGKRVKIESGSVIYGGVRIGNDSGIGHNTLIRFNTIIGTHSVIANLCVLEGNIKIGDHTLVHSNSTINQKTTIGNYVFVAPACVTINDPKMYFRRKEYSQSGKHWDLLSGPTIHDGARVGAGVIIFPGVRVGAHAVLGAGSIITDDVPDYAVVYGDPSRIRRFIEPDEDVVCECKVDHS